MKIRYVLAMINEYEKLVNRKACKRKVTKIKRNSLKLGKNVEPYCIKSHLYTKKVSNLI